VGELRRRIFGPEKMNATLVLAYLRKAKSSTALRALREKLAYYGIPTTAGSTKGLQITSWTSLSESEASNLAMETTNNLMKVSLPPASIKDESLGLLGGIVRALHNRMRKDEIRDSIDVHLLRFNMITHNFGISFFSDVLLWIMKFSC
ncbi:hypothetical protein PFISCL1PPCAC_1646, partial [Pristionchus fissidentatus]